MIKFFQDIVIFDWAQNHLRGGLRCLPGFIILLLCGLVFHQESDCAIAAAGAMSVGFGSFQRLQRSRVKVMVAVSVAIGLAAGTGSLASRSSVAVAVVVALWAFVYGLLTAWESGLSWMGLQCVIVAALSSGVPAGPRQALLRAGLTLVGGLLQAGIITGIWRLVGPPDEVSEEMMHDRAGAAAETPPWYEHLRRHCSPYSPVGRYAFQLSIALATAAVVYRWLHLPNGYWVPMTAVIVLKPEFHQTFSRGLARVAGTLLGVGLSTLMAATLQPGPVALAALVVGFAWLCYALIKVNYALFAVSITCYVAFLLALVGLPTVEVVKARLVATTLGGALSLLVYLLPFPAERADAASEGEAMGV